MAEDFARLVSQANPAYFRQYQPANSSYRPSEDSPNGIGMDPFFDDDDDDPDSAFPGARPRETDPHTHIGKSGATETANAQVEVWNFDDDDPFQAPASNTLVATFAPPAVVTPSKTMWMPYRKPKWKWPWQKEKALVGDRLIALNNQVGNSEYPANFVFTSKYDALTFTPKFLTGSCIVPNSYCSSCAFKSNFPNTPISFSCLLLSSNKFLGCHPRISTPLLSRLRSSSLRLRLKKFRRTLCVLQCLFRFYFILFFDKIETTSIRFRTQRSQGQSTYSSLHFSRKGMARHSSWRCRTLRER